MMISEDLEQQESYTNKLWIVFVDKQINKRIA